VELIWLIAFGFLLLVAVAGAVLACWRYERLVQRWMNPPRDYLIEQASEAFRRGDNKGGNDLMAMKLAELKARAALGGSDAGDYLETHPGITP